MTTALTHVANAMVDHLDGTTMPTDEFVTDHISPDDLARFDGALKLATPASATEDLSMVQAPFGVPGFAMGESLSAGQNSAMAAIRQAVVSAGREMEDTQAQISNACENISSLGAGELLKLQANISKFSFTNQIAGATVKKLTQGIDELTHMR